MILENRPMNEVKNNKNNSNQLDNLRYSIDYKKYLIFLLSKWYWLLLSIIICVGIVYFYNKTINKKYTVETTLLFKENSGQSNQNMGGTYGNLINNLNQ